MASVAKQARVRERALGRWAGFYMDAQDKQDGAEGVC